MTSIGSDRHSPTDDDDDLRELVSCSGLPMLMFRVADGQILELSRSLVVLFATSRESMLGRSVLDFVIDESGTRARWALMAAGELDGYHVSGRGCRRPDGSKFVADVSVNSFGVSAPRRCAVGIFLPEGSTRPEPTTTANPSDVVVLGTVDAEWLIDRISPDIEQLLGHQPSDVVGGPIAALVEPADLSALLVGVARSLQTPGGAAILLRMQTANGTRRQCRMLVTRLAHDDADRHGFAFAITDSQRAHVVGRSWELERVLQHIAREIEATGVLAGSWATSATPRVPALSGLSSRELEIVRRLVVGDRVPMIAQQLFLSESTVRNHLTSVYRKLGVRSQQQLLSLLRAEQVR